MSFIEPQPCSSGSTNHQGEFVLCDNNGPFVRKFIQNDLGVVLSVVNLTLNGAPYVPVGPVIMCSSGGGGGGVVTQGTIPWVTDDLTFASDKVDASGSAVTIEPLTFAEDKVDASGSAVTIEALTFAEDKVDVTGSTVAISGTVPISVPGTVPVDIQNIEAALYLILKELQRPLWVDRQKSEVRTNVVEGSLTSVTTVNSVLDDNITKVQSANPQDVWLRNEQRAAWSQGVRSRIS